jgi:hypothetical protein
VLLDGPAALWLAVVAIGVYHGWNPAMGWPLAVANGLSARRDRAVFATLAPLGAGHLLAMAIVLVPFTLLALALEWNRTIRVGAGVLVLLFGVYKLLERRHPRALVRIRPTQLALWSFLMATAHGAGLMLVPIALGLCGPATADGVGAQHHALTGALPSGLAAALAVSVVHTLAMMASGLAMAWTVYRYLGLRFLARGWINLDVVWALSLVLAGGISAAMALATTAH